MTLADLIRLHGEVLVQSAQVPVRIRVTEHSLRGSAVDVPTPEGRREIRIHPDDYASLLEKVPTSWEPLDCLSGLPIIHDYKLGH